MTHRDVLNFLLSNCCGLLDDEGIAQNGGFQRFRVELHCNSYIIEAKNVFANDYEIKSCVKDQ